MRGIKFKALINYSPPADIKPPWWEYYSTFDQPTWLDYAKIIVKDLQFTGLYDKNRKEIYEGDVIYHEVLSSDDPALPGRYGYSSLVEFCLGTYRVYWNEKWHILSIDVNAASLEVIGNIYENQELIK